MPAPEVPSPYPASSELLGGRWEIHAVLSGAMGTVLLYSGLLITLNFVVDLLYAVVDQRVELR
jgi:hypothetical protein